MMSLTILSPFGKKGIDLNPTPHTSKNLQMRKTANAKTKQNKKSLTVQILKENIYDLKKEESLSMTQNQKPTEFGLTLCWAGCGRNSIFNRYR